MVTEKVSVRQAMPNRTRLLHHSMPKSRDSLVSVLACDIYSLAIFFGSCDFSFSISLSILGVSGVVTAPSPLLPLFGLDNAFAMFGFHTACHFPVATSFDIFSFNTVSDFLNSILACDFLRCSQSGDCADS